MNPPSPEDLEKRIHRTLRALPSRPAPATLELRVMAEIVRRNTQRRKRFGWANDGSLGLRIVLVLLSVAVGGVLCSIFWLPGWLPGEFGVQIEKGTVLIAGIVDASAAVFRSIPTLWFYGVLAVIAVLYGALFGLGATAYRLLAPQRE